MKFNRAICAPLPYAIAMATLSLAPSVVNAQSTASILLEEIVVTATKKKNVENVQDVPASISAFGEAQLDALKVRDISDLSFATPNVQLDDIGTVKSTANFAIRGLGVNSSIPSIDPAVGVFVDGLYFGINSGVIFDTFDLESIEILRGPQGVLFGRNVTGGAVVVNTNDASFESQTKFKVALESGLRGTGEAYTIQGTTTGTLVEDKLAGKIGIYYNDDKGWFENTRLDGSQVDFGINDTILIRPSLTWTPSENVRITAKYEFGEFSGDGPAGQSHISGTGLPGQIVNFDRDSFDFSINDGTFSDSEWDSLVVETNIDVAFGDGQITSVVGYRNFSSLGLSDIDATPLELFHAEFGIEQDQISSELRYNGQFGKWNITTGLFYFEQDIAYDEVRFILPEFFASIGAPQLSTRSGGGVQDQKTLGLFAQAEYQVNDKLTLNAGLRYSDEEKEVSVASVLPGIQTDNNCRITRGDCIFDFSAATNPGQNTFETDNVSPKFGFQYAPNDSNLIYGSWSRSFRAGGFNFRNTSADTVNFGPGPFEDEEVDSIELGWKSEPTSGTRLNASVFLTNIEGLQRELNMTDPVSGIVQVIRNSADAEIFGIEIDGHAALSDNLFLTGSIGILDGDYEEVFLDLSGDGVIDETDLNLNIPRLAELTYNIGLIHESDLGSLGSGSLRLNFSHRDETSFNDNNLGSTNEIDRIDASFTLRRQNGLSFSLYGKNLTNESNFGGDSPLPAMLGPVALGGSFGSLIKGRVVGLEVQGDF